MLINLDPPFFTLYLSIKRNRNMELQKIALLAVNAFFNGKYANFSRKDICKCGISDNTIPKVLKDLCESGELENCTVPGYYARYKIKNPTKCPDFIFKKGLTQGDKLLILKCQEIGLTEPVSVKEFSRRIVGRETSNYYKPIRRIEESGKTIWEYINTKDFLDFSEPNLEEVEVTDKGWKYRQISTRSKREDTPENFLYRKSRDRFRQSSHIESYDLTEEKIKKILEEQDYKDYYTGIKPVDYKEYSIDRINSEKGYTYGNIVITTNRINLMKGDMTIEEFKEQIKLLYSNIENF